MKKITLFFVLIALSQLSFAQVYKAEYSVKHDFGRMMSRMPPDMQKQLIKEQKKVHVFELTHINGKSAYLPAYTMMNGEREELKTDSRRGQMETYKDFTTGYYYAFNNLLNENTGIRDTVFLQEWQYDQSRDTTIYGFSCQSAYYEQDGLKTTAWYVPNLPVMDGPGRFSGLPGLIVRVQSERQLIELIDLQVVDAQSSDSISIPTREKYIKQKEMRQHMRFSSSRRGRH